MSMNIQRKKKIALVLSGGGVKAAAYHIGVCLALREKGFVFAGGSKELVQQKYSLEKTGAKTIRLYVGSSAGAFIAAMLAAGKSLDSLIGAFRVGDETKATFNLSDKGETLKSIGYRHLFNLNSKKILSWLPESLMYKSLITGGLEAFIKNGFKLNGLFNANGIERYLRKYVLDENDFSRLGVELYIVATQLNHSRKTIFGPFLESSYDQSTSTRTNGYTKISEAVAASVSLPPVYAPYPIKSYDGQSVYHYDGEVRDTLSTHIASDHGADLVIASYSMQPYHYSSEIGSLHKFGIPAILNQALYQVLEQKVIRHIQFQDQKKDLYSSLKLVCEEMNFDAELKKKILDLVKSKLDFNPAVDHIYVSPRPQDHEMFFADHFSLNAKILERIVRIGFKAGILALRDIKN